MRTFYIISETEMKEVGTWYDHLAAAPVFQHRLNVKVGELVSEEEFEWGWYVKTESYQGEGHHVFKTEKEAIEKYNEWSQWNGNLQAFTHKPVLVAIPKEEKGKSVCSCGGGENDGHDWNCPWQEDEPKEEKGLTVEKIKKVTDEVCKSPASARKFLQDAGIIPKEGDDGKYFFDAIQEIPLRIAIEVSNQMFCLGILSDLGYREKKSWGDDEDELYDKLMMLASKQSEHIINHLKEYGVNPEIKLKDVKEEKEERTFTRDEYENKAKKIIGRLNAYCLKQDGRRLGLPVLDEVAMAEMSDIVCKILKQ